MRVCCLRVDNLVSCVMIPPGSCWATPGFRLSRCAGTSLASTPPVLSRAVLLDTCVVLATAPQPYLSQHVTLPISATARTTADINVYAAHATRAQLLSAITLGSVASGAVAIFSASDRVTVSSARTDLRGAVRAGPSRRTRRTVRQLWP